MSLYGRDSVISNDEKVVPPANGNAASAKAPSGKFLTHSNATQRELLPHVEGMSEEEVMELKEAFTMFDKDGDGTINAEELGTALRSLGQNPSKEEIAKMITDLDNDGSGSIEFLEFAVMMGKKTTQTSEQELVEAFKFFDQEKNGIISKDELGHTLKSLGIEVDDDMLTEMMEAADTDNNNMPETSTTHATASSIGLVQSNPANPLHHTAIRGFRVLPHF